MFPLEKLPRELQDKIWIAALPEPRDLFLRRNNRGFWQWRASHQQTPNLLHVSWGARTVCLQRYAIVQTSDDAPCTYIDYTADTVFICPPCPVLHWLQSFAPVSDSVLESDCAIGLDVERVRHLIVPEVDWYMYPLHSFSILHFQNLYSLTFFLDSENKAVLDNESSLATLCRLLGCSISEDVVKWFTTHVTYIALHNIGPPEWYSTVWVSGEIAALKFGRV